MKRHGARLGLGVLVIHLDVVVAWRARVKAGVNAGGVVGLSPRVRVLSGVRVVEVLDTGSDPPCRNCR